LQGVELLLAPPLLPVLLLLPLPLLLLPLLLLLLLLLLQVSCSPSGLLIAQLPTGV
jgi:hypothetical protein